MVMAEDECLLRAQAARAIAATASPEFRDDFVRVAEQWEMLAKLAIERRAAQSEARRD